MAVYNTKALTEGALKILSEDLISNVYNGLDCCITLEVYDELMRELSESPEGVQKTYAFALQKQPVFMEMEMRGLLVDLEVQDRVRQHFIKIVNELTHRFDMLCLGVLERTFNVGSHVQIKQLFYDAMGIKPIKSRNSKGVYAPTVDEDAMLKLCQNYWAEPFARYVLAIREYTKKISFLNTDLGEGNRFRTSVNIAGTVTGRSASSASDFGDGSNLQNVDRTLRMEFVPDEGYIYVNVDLEQADARNLGASIYNMFYESHGPEEAGKFLDACESGDLHTTVCRMTWSELPWGDDPKKFKSIAKTPFGDGDSYRDKAKKLGHGTNYLGQPKTMATHTKTAVKIIAEFQKRYFLAFPLIPEWHKKRIAELMETGMVTTIYGRRRCFFNRLDEASTHREAIAYEPQSMTGEEIDRGVYNLWANMPEAQILIQVHDSILFQVPVENHVYYIDRALELLKYEIELKGGRKFSVPLEAKIGWNWGDVIYDDKGNIVGNEYGLLPYKGEEKRPRPNKMQKLKDFL